MTLILVLAACGGGSAPTDNSGGTPSGGTGGGTVVTPLPPQDGNIVSLDRIQGNLSATESHGGTLTLYNSYTKGADGFTTELVSTNVSSDGAVSLPLTQTPPSTEFGSFLGGNCNFVGTSQGGAGKVAIYFQTALTATQGDPVGDVTETVTGSGGATFVLRAYADSVQTYQGTSTCSNGSVTNFNVSLQKGWNALTYRAASSASATVATAPANTRTELTLEKYTPKVLLLLDTTSLTLKAGESVTTKATFYQVGALSGNIDLSTDVPGLSVEPASVNLAPLGTQKTPSPRSVFSNVFRSPKELHALQIGTQKLSTTLTFKAAGDTRTFSGTMNLTARQAGAEVGKTTSDLRLTAPGVTATVPNTQNVTVERYQTVPVDVQVSGQDLYTGAAQVSLENLPSGVTATSATVSFSGTSNPEQITTQLKVNASASAVPGSTTAQLVVTAAGKVTRSPLTVIVPVPDITVSFDQANSGYLYQGEQKTVSITLQSRRGFDSAVTLNLQGLPTGVSADPVSIQTVANQKSTASFIVRSTANSDVGRVTLKITGSALTGPMSATEVEIRPAHFSTLGLDSVNVFAAHEGVWLVGAAQAGSLPGQYSLPVRRVTTSGLIVSTTLSVDTDGAKLINSPNGDLVVLGAQQIIHLKDDGTQVTWPYKTVFALAASPAIVDNQNQLWFYIFANGYQLFKFDLETGQKQAVRSEPSNNGSTALYRNPAGTFVYVTGVGDGAQVRQFTTSTGENKLLNSSATNTTVLGYAVDQNGGLWSKTASSLVTLDVNGVVSTKPDTTTIDRMAFDGNQTLWMSKKGGDALWRVASNQSSLIPTGVYLDSSPLTSAGLWLVSQSAANSNDVYLSLLK